MRLRIIAIAPIVVALMGVASITTPAQAQSADAPDNAQAAASSTVELRNAMNNKCLEVYAFDPHNGARAGLWDCWGGSIQQWYWDGSQIRSRFNNKCLEIYAFDPHNGATAGLWDCWGGANQQWYTVGG